MSNPYVYSELMVVERAALARGPRMRGLGGLAGITRTAAAGMLGNALAATEAQAPGFDSYRSAARARVSDLYQRYIAPASRGAELLGDGEEEVVRSAIAALIPPWYASHDWTGTYFPNGAVLGIGVGALALVAGGIYWWSRRR